MIEDYAQSCRPPPCDRRLIFMTAPILMRERARMTMGLVQKIFYFMPPAI
jgi:hypothetical protein